MIKFKLLPENTRFWKTSICYKFDSLPIFQDLSEKFGSDISEHDFQVLCRKRTHNLRDLLNLVNQYFPNDTYMAFDIHG